MTTTTIDTCLVHQTKAQRNHCAVAKSKMYPAQSDLQCSDYHMCIKIIVNVPLWTKMFVEMRMTWILSDAFKYTATRLSGCQDLLISKKPYVVAEIEVNAWWKLDRTELTTMTWLRLESLVQLWQVFSLLGCHRTPTGTTTSCTTEGMFDRRCRSIDIPKYTLMKTEHVSIYADERALVSALVLLYMLAPPLMPQHCCTPCICDNTRNTEKESQPPMRGEREQRHTSKDSSRLSSSLVGTVELQEDMAGLSQSDLECMKILLLGLYAETLVSAHFSMCWIWSAEVCLWE